MLLLQNVAFTAQGEVSLEADFIADVNDFSFERTCQNLNIPVGIKNGNDLF